MTRARALSGPVERCACRVAPCGDRRVALAASCVEGLASSRSRLWDGCDGSFRRPMRRLLCPTVPRPSVPGAMRTTASAKQVDAQKRKHATTGPHWPDDAAAKLQNQGSTGTQQSTRGEVFPRNDSLLSSMLTHRWEAVQRRASFEGAADARPPPTDTGRIMMRACARSSLPRRRAETRTRVQRSKPANSAQRREARGHCYRWC